MATQVLFEPFKQQEDFLEAVLVKDYTTIIYGGSIRSGKTYAGLGALIILCKQYPQSRWVVVRKDLSTIKRNTIPSWEKIKPINSILKFTDFIVTFRNGSKIIFFGENFSQDKDLNRWKGLEVNGFLLEEINELQEVSYYKAVERAGSYIIPNTDKQPKPLIIGTVNPTFGWVKKLFYDKFMENTLPENVKFIKARIFDNPFIPDTYKENLKSLPTYQYQVFVEGNWNIRLKTGGEFLRAFELEEHLSVLDVVPDSPIHVSIDANVLPYIAVTFWQINQYGDLFNVEQVHELPCRDPDNSAFNAGRKTAKWLNSINYDQKIFLYGDQTTKARNSIDPQKRSFYDLYVLGLKEFHYRIEDRFFRKNPIVSATGDFINDILENRHEHLKVSIGEHCTESISDYIESKADVNGGILKSRIKNASGQSYEKNGHILDTFRYFICKAFESDFKKYSRSKGFSFTSKQFSEVGKNY